MSSKRRILVAISGGVDSAVAAAILKTQGHEVTAVHFRTPLLAGSRVDPQADARHVAERLGIELVVEDLSPLFGPLVEHFISQYAQGRTPNPCCLCNATVKFRRLIELADETGVDAVATGHHARVAAIDGQPAICRGAAKGKDQSYALFSLPRSFLPRLVFPVGELAGKDRVRSEALRLGLGVHDKPDSQEVCFLGDGSYVDLLAERAPAALTPGPIIDAGGNEVGRHDGYARYTIGQRRGLRYAAGKPVYVTAIDAATATVRVGAAEALLSSSLSASGANWHADMPEGFTAAVQVRYHHQAASARIRRDGSDRFAVEFEEPVSAVTPGQAAVIYDGQRLIGGGWIDSSPTA